MNKKEILNIFKKIESLEKEASKINEQIIALQRDYSEKCTYKTWYGKEKFDAKKYESFKLRQEYINLMTLRAKINNKIYDLEKDMTGIARGDVATVKGLVMMLIKLGVIK